MPKLIFTFVFACAGIVGIFFFLSPQPSLTPLWDLSNAWGYLAATLLLMLFIFTGRPLASPFYEGKFFMHLHRDLGFGIGLLIGLHIVFHIFNESEILEYILPSAPWYMLAGVAATLSTTLILLLSLIKVRRRIWSNHSRFKTYHFWIGALILILTGIHILGSGFYSQTGWKRVAWCTLTVAALWMPYLVSRRSSKNSLGGGRVRNRANRATLFAGAIIAFCLALSFLVVVVALLDFPL
ncbi:ferric reductase-like transmembrane domain-containing protein [Pseudomonas aeruginosa]|uniref:ferric reductase-like transmembrane domain-containing protein n=1 Tax=Pseudomonas aeruginosa TaxID=287 RepID=UPI000EB449FC|nr:ferric reductase-like transmembrane domain-containing protein [Pseudomonas aeruginosa]NNB83826.1 ferric reductase like transmembrane component [Pseudomonas aeruginosa]